ncbi:hypothetical protein [Paenibacillus sp. UNC496MF]|uniref:hypothetical protein n=1 Tax=Paenibacillus sp. UNC496MF TaxID=1502753 RepID=UPI00210B0703|nr:hypothetical protein [Paenibacillus sp. UNC496MF]
MSDATDEEKLELIRVLKKIGYGIKQRRIGRCGQRIGCEWFTFQTDKRNSNV